MVWFLLVRARCECSVGRRARGLCVDPTRDHETIHAKRGSSTRGFSRRAVQWRPDSYRRLLSIHPHGGRGARDAGVSALLGVVRQPGNSLTWHLFMPLLVASETVRVRPHRHRTFLCPSNAFPRAAAYGSQAAQEACLVSSFLRVHSGASSSYPITL
jgi:hypothetical protein